MLADDGALTVFAVNRDTVNPTDLELAIPHGLAVAEALTLTTPAGGDRFTANTATAQPVAPAPLAASFDNGVARADLPALSWSVIRFTPTSETSSD